MANFVARDVVPLPKGAGRMTTCFVSIPNPLPCVVILIHGVNDIGEAFENLDKGICAGLNQRLGRNDLKPNTWKITGDEKDAEIFSPQVTIVEEGFSPVIPFFWGYRPVDKEAYKADQKAYYERLKEGKEKDPELPYDSYWMEREAEILSKEIKLNKLNCDKFGNWIDHKFHRNGGPFANATTCIPDMYGPGLANLTAWVATVGSDLGAKAYYNPHRIYLAYAAHRLALLIKQIREDTDKQDIPINIIAHSQGTIITMLATLILDQEGKLPADCTILAHSPYAMETAFFEELSKDFSLGIQTDSARQETFINFVKAMSDGQDRRGGTNRHLAPDFLTDYGVVSITKEETPYIDESGNEHFYDRLGKDYELFYRNNFGKVYNYFSPNDHVVSLPSVLGMGWQGIPDEIIDRCIYNNLKQRIFSHHYVVGNESLKPKYDIPLESHTILEQDYPEGISRQDYDEREPIGPHYDIDMQFTLPLTEQQLELLTQLPQFKGRQGRFISGHYQKSGTAILVQYLPKLEEFQSYVKRSEPLTNYHKVTRSELDYACLHGEYAISKLDDKIEEQWRKANQHTIFKTSKQEYLQEQAKLNCKEVSTSYRVTRTVTGESVPEPFIYQVDKPGKKTPLSRAIHYGDLLTKGYIDKLQQKFINVTMTKPDWLVVDEKTLVPLPNSNPRSVTLPPSVYTITDKAQLERLAAENGWDRGVKVATYSIRYIGFRAKEEFVISRYLTKAELEAETSALVEEVKNTSSHHSGITMNYSAAKNVMAYDLAIGLVDGIEPCKLHQLRSWRHFADWRSEDTPDNDSFIYMKRGILPPDLKEAMGYPEKHMPSSVVNEYITYNYLGTGAKAKDIELEKPKYRLLTTYPKVQFIMPEPDLKTE
ncbi:hypothetical protein PT276_00505 [Orbaceae bacterium ESL0721]|nr:hypothetical protein [Orbaceae bacterium ESL0721]